MPEPRAILHVVNCLNVGGTERQMFELIRRLDRRRWRLLMATLKPGGELEPHLRALGVEPLVLDLGGSLTRPQAALSVARLAAFCRRERVRIVHAHDFYSNVIGVTAAQLARARSIASRRDLGHWLGAPQRRALWLALRLADRVIANAQAVGRVATRDEAVPPWKLRVVPNGIDVARFDELARPDPLLPATGSLPRVAMVASMHVPDKGHADLLEAAALLRARGLAAQWLLVSDGDLRPSLERRARELGLDEVWFLGRRDDVPAIWSRVDLAVHASWSEGFPNAVLEAMCAARPVVATRVGGTPEVMLDGETGLLVEPRAPAALAEAIGQLLSAPELRRAMGHRGRARVAARYSLDRMAASIDEIYDELAEDGGLAPGDGLVPSGVLAVEPA